MAVINLSEPTAAQFTHDVERVAGVFVVAFLGSWGLTSYALSTGAIHAAVLAGFAAVYGLVKSFLTTL